MTSVRFEIALLFAAGILATGCKPAWPKCSEDKDCTGEGHHGVCVDGTCQECAKDTDCPKNFVCRGNKCLPKPECTTDSDCPAPKICRGEKCALECSSDAECGAGQTCTGNRCLTKAVPTCTADADCAAGQKCSAGVCVVAGQCQLEPVHFAYNESILDETAKAVLVKDHDCLKTRSGKAPHLSLQGNCDSRGTEEYNLHLGQRRADAVLKYLVNLGIPHHEMRTISYGKDKPICNEENEGCWAQNRRTDLIEK